MTPERRCLYRISGFTYLYLTGTRDGIEGTTHVFAVLFPFEIVIYVYIRLGLSEPLHSV